MLRFLCNFFLLLLPISSAFGLRRQILRFAGARIGPSVSVCGHSWIYGRGSIAIGPSTWVSPGLKVYTHPDAKVEIGENCDIGPNVALVTGGHDFGDSDRRAGRGFAASITIGRGCWIGASSIVLGNVQVGNGAVVAAGSVVVSDVAPNTLVGGNPARRIRDL